jgi:hypothetical protein
VLKNVSSIGIDKSRGALVVMRGKVSRGALVVMRGKMSPAGDLLRGRKVEKFRGLISVRLAVGW